MHALRACLALVCAVVTAVDGRAAAAAEVTLADTLGAVFQRSPAFARYATETRAAEAAHLRSQGAFDVVVSTSLRAQHMLASDAAGLLTDQSYDDVLLEAGLTTRTPQNIGLQLGGALPLVSSVGASLSPDQPRVGASLTLPLLKLGRAAPFGAEERAAALRAGAAAALQADAESELVARVVEYYWRWSAARDALDLARRIEALSRDQLADVDELVAHHARAAADRFAFAAAAANAVAARVEAEQAMYDGEQRLREATGLSSGDAAALPSSALPAVPAASLDAAAVTERAQALAGARPIFVAMARQAAAAGVRTRAARIGERPDLSLVAQGTLTRVVDASEAQALTQSALGSPSGRVGYYGSVALQIALPLQNRAARGAYAEAKARECAVALATAERSNAVRARIDASSRALAALGRSYQERARAAAALQLSYEAERARFRLGTATGLDVVQAEQLLTNASLSAVVARLAYAVARVRLLHESGAIGPAVRTRDTDAIIRALASTTF